MLMVLPATQFFCLKLHQHHWALSLWLRLMFSRRPYLKAGMCTPELHLTFALRLSKSVSFASLRRHARDHRRGDPTPTPFGFSELVPAPLLLVPTVLGLNRLLQISLRHLNIDLSRSPAQRCTLTRSLAAPFHLGCGCFTPSSCLMSLSAALITSRAVRHSSVRNTSPVAICAQSRQLLEQSVSSEPFAFLESASLQSSNAAVHRPSNELPVRPAVKV
jgi:hypothetical protein